MYQGRLDDCIACIVSISTRVQYQRRTVFRFVRPEIRCERIWLCLLMSQPMRNRPAPVLRYLSRPGQALFYRAIRNRLVRHTCCHIAA